MLQVPARNRPGNKAPSLPLDASRGTSPMPGKLTLARTPTYR